MQDVKRTVIDGFKLLLFWILVFDVQRILFSIHNYDKFSDIPWGEWFQAFFFSLRLDLATAGLLSLLPMLVIITGIFIKKPRHRKLFFGVMLIEIILCAMIHGGEINAYPEWNHKLNTRVFTHLLNPDEVVRTADYGMTVWFIVYAVIETVIGYYLLKKLYPRKTASPTQAWYIAANLSIALLSFFTGLFVVLGRGGFQQIPINIDAAYYSKNYVSNDLSVNSVYYFTKSFMLYNRSEIGNLFPRISEVKSKRLLKDLYTYPRKHSVEILDNDRPNVVFIVLESWTADAVGCLNNGRGASPHFDKLAKQGVLFTNIYAAGSTSEIGNTSIFAGYPALPEISISMQPDKHRKLPSINQDLKKWGYSSHYLFSGDLKYGNIGGFFIDHGFDVVEDENEFPTNLPHGKLNYYDEALYSLLLKKINRTKGPFMHCAFTGSTHSPYDFPKGKAPVWKGNEARFMSSVYYADHCLNNFIKACKKEKWYKNTIFVLVADHGHASPFNTNPSVAQFFRIPLLIFGEPIKTEFRGTRIDAIGSQSDIATTLLRQMHGDVKHYQWSKDLLNPKVPQFALHTVIRGYGWITPKGHFTWHMDGKMFQENTFDEKHIGLEKLRCHALMSLLYQQYKSL